MMPVYNGDRYVREAVESVLSQTFTDFELIIVDDGSTDETPEVLESYARNDARIRVFHQPNRGIVAARNRVLEMARGKYIAVMDADDISLPERFATQVDFLAAHPEVGVLGCAVQIIDGEGVPSGVWRYATEHGGIKWQLCFFNPLPHSSVMMKLEVVEQVGGYGSGTEPSEDYDLWRKLSCVTRLFNLPDVLVRVRKHEENVSLNRSSEQKRNAIRVSASMMSSILGKEPPVAVVQSLWERRFDAVSEARPVAELVYRLFWAFTASGELSSSEKQIIRRDAAMRIYGLSRPWASNAWAWGALARACYLDPALARRMVKTQLHRLFRWRPRPLREPS
jgi:glycosyltransferase involved in cell wall biosynthesis